MTTNKTYNKLYRRLSAASLLAFFYLLAFSQLASVNSPNKTIIVSLHQVIASDSSSYYLQVGYLTNGAFTEVIPQIKIGLVRNDQSFSKNLKFIKAGKSVIKQESYTTLHGKRSNCSNTGNEITFYFENTDKSRLNLIVRAYNDGLAFRYEFPDKEGNFTILDELTSYAVQDSADKWLQKFDLSNEGLYHSGKSFSKGDWCYPALFRSQKKECWFLVHESDVDRNYCATKLSNYSNPNAFKVTLPYPHEGEGDALPTISLPWKSPWRVVIIGQLANIVESTLIDDVSRPSILSNTNWIKPGSVSWNYWSDNHGTRDYQTVCRFIDLAASMDWPYTLFDWEWDAMTNGGNVEDAAAYALSKGVKPLIWYNSGMFKWITATPMDRMKTHENRVQEFKWLKENGFAGVKIDFFLSEKQYMINYYLDILEDAAAAELMVYFHGCLVPRGWARTYPHLMTYEGVRGAEWYNNNPEFTPTAPQHNSVMPFTRNVAGSMDYTPVTFTNSQYPHLTSYGHELALSILFESGLQHMADRPEGYYNLPDAARSFLKEVPTAWDDTKLIDGFPGKEVFIARRKNNNWYLGGINSENMLKTKKMIFDFLPENSKYKLTIISDGTFDTELKTQYQVVDKHSEVDIDMLSRGGFVMILKPLIKINL